MLDRLLDFQRALRSGGVPVSVSEGIDSLRALEHISIAAPDAMRAALAATLLKSGEHRHTFDVLFDLYFGTGRGAEAFEEDVDDDSDDELSAAVEDAVATGEGEGLRGLARRAVARYGRVDPSRDWYSSYEVARALDLDRLLRMLLRRADELPEPERALRRSELRASMRAFRAAVLAETRRRVAEHRGPEAVASYAVELPLTDQSFLNMSADLDDLRRAIRPLARKLAARIALKRRRGRTGHLDMRRTVRHSLSTGGVPFEPAFRHRVPHRPELFVLCDVSGSVARFARFSLMLTHSLRSQFQRVRSFAFVDEIDEVTSYFEHEDFASAVEAMNRRAQVVGPEGHSDYGSCFGAFLERFGAEVRPKTTLLILGDARNNYRVPNDDALRELADRARHSFWLNPEPRGDWDGGDSVASTYAACVDEMAEVRTLRQLERFIDRLLAPRQA
jgi:uncharacterized protein with von Willebrand factor type A (vWA) domain